MFAKMIFYTRSYTGIGIIAQIPISSIVPLAYSPSMGLGDSDVSSQVQVCCLEFKFALEKDCSNIPFEMYSIVCGSYFTLLSCLS